MNQHFFTSEEMYQFDQYTIHEIGIPSPVLIERAAYATFQHLTSILTKQHKILIVAGKGNNGADAVALARMLYLANYRILLHIVSDKNLSDEMDQQLAIAKNIHLPLTYQFDATHFEEADYLIDGIFGIGLSREIKGIYQEIIQTMNVEKKKKKTLIALDIPSGLSAHTGKVFKTVVQADYTYTFGFKKHGMQYKEGKEVCGTIVVCDIGYPNNQLALTFDVKET